MAIAEHRFRADTEDNEPGRARCAGCHRRVIVRPDVWAKARVAYSEAVDVYGVRRFWCEPCTRELYESA